MYNFIFFYLGLLAILTQLVIFRELALLFYGNELFLGVFLSSWLFWVGLGSLLARRLLKKAEHFKKYFSYAFLALSLLLPFVILFIRLSKNLFSFGEFIGPVLTVFFTFGVMSLLCFIIGGLFSLSCRIASDKIKREDALGRVYMYEALGSVVGGVLFTYLLIGFVPTFIIALIVSLGCILISLAISLKEDKKSALFMLMAFIMVFVSFKIEPMINRFQWGKYKFIQQKEARNGTLSLVQMGSIKNVFVDGMISASFPNPESYEPAAHWPLLANAVPSKILVIGDHSLGALKEVLKHNPKVVDYVVLDSSFIDLLKPYLAQEDILALADKRVNVRYGDARIFVKKVNMKYDGVIINIQEVPNLKLNRFYTSEFFECIKSILAPGGILALSVASSENYLSNQTRMFNSSIYQTLQSVFSSTEVITGDVLVFLSSTQKIDMQNETILGRFKERGISNSYFIPSYIEYKLAVNRRTELKALLEETPGIQLNNDFRPTTYYYFTSFWLNKFSSPLQYLLLGVLALIIIYFVLHKRKSLIFFAHRKECVLIFTLGFTSILLELMFLLGFQIISGYVYWQMGILFASFMLGLFLGSVLGSRFKNTSGQTNFSFLVVLSLILVGLSVYCGYFLPHLVNLSTIQNIIIFLALLVFIGAVVGAAFVVAGFLINLDEIMAKAGSLYSADLWGAALGAIFLPNLIIPFFGLLGAFIFSAVIGLLGLATFLILSKIKLI